jgi:hypothetical protein
MERQHLEIFLSTSNTIDASNSSVTHTQDTFELLYRVITRSDHVCVDTAIPRAVSVSLAPVISLKRYVAHSRTEQVTITYTVKVRRMQVSGLVVNLAWCERGIDCCTESKKKKSRSHNHNR